MSGSKKEEININVTDKNEKGLSAHDLVKAGEKELGMNTSLCNYMQFVIIHLLALHTVIFSLVFAIINKFMVKLKCLSNKIHLLKRGCSKNIEGTTSWKNLDLKHNLLDTKGVTSALKV